jgi:hypothetical protein
MRKVWMASTAAAALLATAAASNVRAGTYIPVPMVPGAVSEIAFSINNHNVVAGSFKDSAGVEHGFFGPLDGSNWTVFDAPFEGTTGTEPRYISDDGAITGIALNPDFKVGEEFYRTPNGKFKIFALNGEPLDGIAQGMNSDDASVGDYLNVDGRYLGYIGKRGRYAKDARVRIHGKGKFPQIGPRGINDFGYDFVGLFVDENGVRHGFLQDLIRGKAKAGVFDYPNASATALEDINQQGVLSGQWEDSSANVHAFIILPVMDYTDLDPKDGSTSQQAWGLNDSGLVALSTNTGQSYIYCPDQMEQCPTGNFATRDRLRHLAKSVVMVLP